MFFVLSESLDLLDRYLLLIHFLFSQPKLGYPGCHPSFLTVDKYDQYHTYYYPIIFQNQWDGQNTYNVLFVCNINTVYLVLAHDPLAVLNLKQFRFVLLYNFDINPTTVFFEILFSYFPVSLLPFQQKFFSDLFPCICGFLLQPSTSAKFGVLPQAKHINFQCFYNQDLLFLTQNYNPPHIS